MWTPKVQRRVMFMLERAMTRGPFFKLLVIWSVIVLVAIIGGVVAMLSPHDDLHGFQDATWWALLRLSDPGYLGEETLPWLRFVALVLTVVGLAMFVGALVAVLTQWLNERVEQLSLGMTPITTRKHFVILGWTSRTLELTATLVSQVRRGSPTVAILVDRVTPDLIQELRDRLGKRYNDRRVILRSGDPHQREHLERVNFREAEAIILPGRQFAVGEFEIRDASTLKVIASLGTSVADLTNPPEVAAEIINPSLVEVARGAYGGLARIIPSDTVIARGLVLGVVSPYFSTLFADLMKPTQGNRFLVHRYPGLVGESVGGVAARFHDAVLVGLGRTNEGETVPHFESDAVIGPEDSLILITSANHVPQPADLVPGSRAEMTRPGAVDAPRVVNPRLLIMGWSGKAPEVLQELSRHVTGDLSVDVVSARSVADREADVAASSVSLEDLSVRHLVGDVRTILTSSQIDVANYDRIIILASDVVSDVESADARTIASHLVLRHLLADTPHPPHVVVELLDPANRALLEGTNSEVVTTPLLMSDVLAAVVTQPELEMILPGLWTGRYGFPRIVELTGIMPMGTSYTCLELEQHLRRFDLVTLALREGGRDGQVSILPDKIRPREVRDGDEVVVLNVGFMRRTGAS